MERHFYSTEELLALKQTGGCFVLDVESFPNYFLCGFKEITSNKYAYFEAIDNQETPSDWLQWMIDSFCTVGFNSIPYDLVIISLAICRPDLTASDLHEATVKLIVDNMRPHDLLKEYGAWLQKPNHVDLIEVAPLTGSLKLYAARLHCRHMQDLPFHPNTVLTPVEIATVRTYNFNDLDNTQLLLQSQVEQLNLRAALSVDYEQDLRSKSDAQIAEAVIIAEVKKVTGEKITRPKVDTEKIYKYRVPEWLRFQTPQLQSILQRIAAADFYVNEFGVLQLPTDLEGLAVTLGDCIYRMGIGGLHSSEKCAAHVADEYTLLIDRDVASYYPYIILTLGLFPAHIGPVFLQVYRAIVDRRIAAKKAKIAVIADSLKITINGSFGKFGSPYSDLYAPELLLQVTLTGQLGLLMIIEMLECCGVPVVSGNTDGILIKCKKTDKALVDMIFREWEKQTGFVTEETFYKAVYARDVNNYVAIKTDGKHKAKGVYSEVGSAGNSPLSKNPEALICADAAIEHMISGKPIVETILECKQIQRFVVVRNVKGGSQKDGKFLGKVVRWYYAKQVLGSIVYCKSGNKVPNSDGGKPLMTLPGAFPDDIDVSRYANMATEILEETGFQKKRNQQLTLV